MEKQWHARRQKNPAAKNPDFDCISKMPGSGRESTIPIYSRGQNLPITSSVLASSGKAQ